MRRGKRYAGLAAVIVLLAAGEVFVQARPASATTVNVQLPKTITSDGQSHDLADVTFTARASWKYYITGKLVFDGATAAIHVATRIDCDGTTNNPISYTSTNDLPSDPSRFTYTRALWDPPAGTPTCKFSVISDALTDPNHTGSVSYAVQSGSYLDVTTVPDTSGTAYDAGDPNNGNENKFLTNGNAYDAAVLEYTPPATATGLHTVSDINVTDCEGVYPGTESVPGCTSGTALQNSTITYNHEVLQYNTGHTGYCATSSTGPTTITINQGWHHYKLNSEDLVAISNAAGCSRDFRIKTYVQSVSGNPIVVQRGTRSFASGHGPYSESIAIPS